jgi:hypothetical protein
VSDAYTEFFLGASPSVVQLELVELTHPNLSQDYRFVRNYRSGLTVTMPVVGPLRFEYWPMRISRGKTSDDLVQRLTIDLGPVNETLAAELDLIAAADGFSVRPTLRYWVYRSDAINAGPLVGPLRFEVTSVNLGEEGASLEVAAPEVNAHATGELYTVTRFSMLRGFL